MKSMFQLEYSVVTIAAWFAAAGLAYAAFGGLRAIAISDTFNGIGLLVMGLLVTFFAMQAIDWDLSGIPVERLSLIGADDSDIPWHTLLTGMVFIHLFYWGTNMVIAQRAMAARSVREAQKGIYAAAAFKMIIPAVVVLPGVIAFKLYGDVWAMWPTASWSAMCWPAWLSGAFAAVITGAVLSSYNSCLNSAGCALHLRPAREIHQPQGQCEAHRAMGGRTVHARIGRPGACLRACAQHRRHHAALEWTVFHARAGGSLSPPCFSIVGSMPEWPSLVCCLVPCSTLCVYVCVDAAALHPSDVHHPVQQFGVDVDRQSPVPQTSHLIRASTACTDR
jgi:hypothetical protein